MTSQRAHQARQDARVRRDIGRAPRNVDAQALALATELDDSVLQGWGETALAEVARRQGRFDEAAARLGRAEALFVTVGANDGAGQVLQQAGTVAAQRGDYDSARARYLESIAIREELRRHEEPGQPRTRTSRSSTNTAATTRRRALTTSRPSPCGARPAIGGESASR